MKRTFIYGSNTLIAIVLFTAILILINVLPKEMKAINAFGMRIPLQKQWDLTENKKFTLTDQSVKVLARLETPVTAIGFAQKGSAGYTALEDMLKQYAFQSPSFKYQISDPVRDRTLAMQYGIKSMRSLVLETKGADGKPHHDTVTLPPSMGGADYQQMESKITAGLLRIINPKTATVYFTRGHGEAEIDDQNPQTGLSLLKAGLEGENYVVKSIFLYNEKSVPADATLVVVAGVTKDFLPDEVKALQRYLSGGGRMLVFYPSDPLQMKTLSNFDALLSAQGIVAQNDLVISQLIAPLSSRERLLAPAVNKYGTSPITERFTVPTVFPVARSFKIDKPPKDAHVTPLATTVADTWEIRHPLTRESLVVLTTSEDPLKIYEAAKDSKGEANLAVVGTYPAVPADLELAPTEGPKPAVQGFTPVPAASTAPSAAPSGAPSAGPSAAPATAPSAAPSSASSGAPAAVPSPTPQSKTEARVIVFGSVQMIMGSFFGMLGNGDIVMNSVAWLAERTEQIAINRPEAKKQPITLDDVSRQRLSWFAMPFVPCIVAALGVMLLTMSRRY